jgi:hypothetical protein
MKHIQRRAVAASALAALLLASCDDNPVDDKGHIECDHFEAEGFDLVYVDSTLHSQFQGSVYGTVSVSAGGLLSTVRVLWLDTDSTHVAPAAECDQSLAFDVANSSIVGVTQSAANPWAIDIHGKQAGSTTFRVKIFHVDHADFTSLAIPITVAASPLDTIAPPAMVIMDGADAIATHNFDETNGPGQVTGPIVLQLGQNRTALEVWFVDGSQHAVDGSRDRVIIPDGPHSLSWSISETAVFDAVANAASEWHLDLVPKAVGKATIQFRLLFDGSPRYTSGDVPVVVTSLQPADFNDDYAVKKNGVWNVIVNQGVVQATHCRTANPGRYEVAAGDLTDLYFLKFIDVACNELAAGSWNVQFEFADDGVAKIVHHPFHWNEKDEFHVMGVAPGQTTVRMFLIQSGDVKVVSPPIDVLVTEP